jgi:uncharacterized protein YbjT (DUF2867 family)
VGGQVVEQLVAQGEKVRVFTRNANKLARRNGHIEVSTGDFANSDSFARAASDVQGLFLMSRDPDLEVFRNLVDAAKRADTRKIVFLSSLGASRPESAIGKLHKEKEEIIQNSGVDAAFLRPGGFMSNTYQWIDSIRSQNVVYNAMGTGKFAPIAPEDIGAVAVHALTATDEPSNVMELTGSELLSVPEQVGLLAQALGRSIECVEISTDTAVQGMLRAGIPQAMASAVAESFEGIRQGRFVEVGNTFERVMERKPLTFAAWVQRHLERFA